MKQNSIRISLLLAFALSSVAPAYAFNIGVKAGLGLPSGNAFSNAKSPAVGLGGELTWGLGMLHLGGFYDHAIVTLKTPITSGPGVTTSGTGAFYGAVGRVELPATSVFVDAKLGFSTQSAAGTTSDSAFGFGIGAGYKMSLGPFFSLSPRVAYLNLPYKAGTFSDSGSMIDVGLLAQIGF